MIEPHPPEPASQHHSPSTVKPSALRRTAHRWGRLCSGGVFLAFLLCELAGGRWPIVLITPYMPQLVAIALVGLFLLLASARGRRGRGDWVFGSLAMLALFYGSLITAGRIPWRTIPPAKTISADQPNLGRIKVMIANVHTANPDHKTILHVIAEEDPDVVLLPEVNDAWMSDLRTLNEKYPLHSAMPDSLGNFGIAFYSRLPGTVEWLTATGDGQDDGYAVPQVAAKLTLTGPANITHEVRFFGLHPLPPIRTGNKIARDAVLAKVGQLASTSAPSIVAGDLNATRYCNAMQFLVDPGEMYGGLSDATSPIRFSWPNTWSWWAMGIRIDHILTTHNWRVIEAHAGRDIGSDHMPIIATLQLVREQK